MYRSPLRYPGGKSKAIKEILKYIPSSITEYREPFIGGGSVFYAIKGLYGDSIQQYQLNDLNRDLILFYWEAQENNQGLVNRIQFFKDRFRRGRELWDYLHTENNITDELERAARYFILNRITFSGLVDFGGYSQHSFETRFTQSSIERVRNLAIVLEDVDISYGDYADLLYGADENAFIFLDPPYASVGKLYGVNGELHKSFDHERFAVLMRECPHKWLITYNDCEKVRDLFSFANISEWALQYGMNNYKQKNARKGNELFIRNY